MTGTIDDNEYKTMVEKLGIERRLITAGKHKGLLDPFLPANTAQAEHLQTLVDDVHRHFIASVRAGRGNRLKDNSDLFTGLVWAGEKAISLGLADEYGNALSIADHLEIDNIIDYSVKELLFERLLAQLGANVVDSFTSMLATNLN